MFESTPKSLVSRAVLPTLLLLTPACAETGDDGNTAIEIEGRYTDGFSTHEITTDAWTTDDTAVFHIVDFDNAAGLIIAENDTENDYAPGLWSRFDWTWDGDDLYYCQSVFDGDDEKAARDAEGADVDDLDAGCSGFPWSPLTPA